MPIPLLTHYSATPVDRLAPMEPQSPLPQPKPKGFWVSVDEGGEGWADWCRSEEFRLDTLAYIHDISIWHKTNLVLIENPKALDQFTLHYGENAFPGTRFRMTYIRWDRVAARYSGIVIAPYLWSRRLNIGSEWYYGWDCASGCIWDVGAVASVVRRQRAA